MKQVIHIFKKDVRRHWPEILLSLAVLALFVWHEPSQWRYRDYLSNNRMSGFLTGAINIGLMLCWCVLTVRLIQSDSLVGDRQFWITRPYEWKKLLAAKIFFLLVFVYVPAIIAGIILLGMAGFHSPLSFLTDFLALQFTGSIIMMILFTMALAVVTKNFVHFIWASLCLGVFIGGIAGIVSYLPSVSFSPGTDDLQEGLMIFACAAAVLWQFARRKTLKTRLLLTGAAVMIGLLAIATPYEALIAREYPLTDSARLPIKIVFDPVKPPAPKIEPDNNDEVEVKFPLVISEVLPDLNVALRGEMLKITLPEGKGWNSGWEAESGRYYTSRRLGDGSSKLEVSFKIKKKFFETIQTVPVKAEIYLAMTASRDKESHQFIVQAGDFTVPEIGICSIVHERSGNTLRCRAPFKTRSGRATIRSSDVTCPPSAKGSLKPGLTTDEWYGGGSADFVSPVETVDLFFWTWNQDSSRDNPGPDVCPGTPVILTDEETVQRAGTKIEIDGIRLADYRESNSFTFSILGR